MIRVAFFLLLWAIPAIAETPNILSQAKQDMQHERYPAAINKLRQLVNHEQNNYEAWFLFGVAHVHEQQSHQAIEAFRHVITLRPDLAEPHNNLAAVYNNLGDTKAAVHELEVALEKRPSYAAAEENLADLYVKLALENYRNSLKHGGNPAIEKRYTRLLQVRNPMLRQKVNQNSTTEAKPQPEPITKQEVELQLPVEKSITGVLDALEAWRSAWASQDLTAYFSAYVSNYKPDSKFSSSTAWKIYKTRMIKDQAPINIQFEQVDVDIPKSRNTAVIHLHQILTTDSYNERIQKQINMKYTPNGWKIITEVAIP